jgi:hypothetical protein
MGEIRRNDGEFFQGVQESLFTALGELQTRNIAMYENTAKVRAVWGEDVFAPMLLYKVFVDGFDQAFQEAVALLTAAQVLPESGLQNAPSIPWGHYLDDKATRNEVNAQLDALSKAIESWAKSAGAVAKPSWHLKRKLRKAVAAATSYQDAKAETATQPMPAPKPTSPTRMDI